MLKVKNYKKELIFSAFFLSALVVYYITSPGRTPYNYFVYLSDAILHGRYWLVNNPSWLNELIPWDGGSKFFVINPPAPSLLLLPFVWLYGLNFQQQYLAHALGALSAVVVAVMAMRVTNKWPVAVWSFILTAFGSVLFYLSSQGSVWFLGQVCGFTFGVLALLECLGKKRVWLVGLFAAFAILSRQQALFALPLYAYMLKDQITNPKQAIIFLFSLSPALAGIPLYNFVRFGSPLETGYRYIPGLLSEPWFKEGIFNYSHIPSHLKIMFTAMPKKIDSWPYLIPSWGGLAIWITTPAFIYSFWAPIRENLVKFLWLTILAIGLINFSFGSTGFIQFGYRYAVDFYPFLVLLTILAVNKTGLKWHHWTLLSMGVLVNVWGVLANNIFGWASW